MGVDAHPHFTEASQSLCNPRDPKPFGKILFPSVVSDPCDTVLALDAHGSGTHCVLGGDVRPKLGIEEARTFVALINRRIERGDTALQDPRTALANLAMIRIQETSGGKTESMPRHHQEEDDGTTEVFLEKYITAVEEANKLRMEFAKEREAWEQAKMEYQKNEVSIAGKLEMAEGQSRRHKEAAERAIEASSRLERENKSLKQNLIEASEQAERFKEVASKHRSERANYKSLAEELQAQVNLLKGSCSVPLFPQNELLELKLENTNLKATIDDLKNRLGEITARFIGEKKSLLKENEDLKAQLLQRGDAAPAA